jgi:hypothetical protein
MAEYCFRLCFKDDSTRLFGEKGSSVSDLLEKLKPFLDERVCYDIECMGNNISTRNVLEFGMKAFKPFCFANADRFEIVDIETNQIIDTLAELSKEGVECDARTAILMDIAKSLAIIADSINKLKIEHVENLTL